MSQILTTQETLRAIADGKKLEYKWYTNDRWSRFDPLHNDVYIDSVVSGKYNFRLAQEMITINGVSFPKPESEPLVDRAYYYANPMIRDLHTVAYWRGDGVDMLLLARGLVHLSKENAIAHAKALVKLSGGSVDD